MDYQIPQLHPHTLKINRTKKTADEQLAAAGAPSSVPPSVYYMKQTIGNACGTIAMLHSFGNSLGTIKLGEACGFGSGWVGSPDGRKQEAKPTTPHPTPPHLPSPQTHHPADSSFLQRFFDATKALTPQQRGAYLEAPPSGAPDIEEAHQVGSSRREV